MAAAAAGLQVVGSAGSAIGNVMSSTVTADSLDRQAESEIAQAEFEERQQRRINRLSQGEAIAKTAASGVVLSSGSPLLHELDRIKQGEIEALNIRGRGQTQAAQTRFQSRMTRRQIPFQILSGITGSASALTSYAGKGGGSGFGQRNALSNAQRYQKQGYS